MRIGLRDIIPVLYSGLYFVLAGGVIALAVLAFREDVPPYARDPPCFLPLRKMAVFLYRKLLEYREKRRKKGKDFPIPGEEGVRNDFSVLYPSIKARRCEIVYRIAKTEKILLLLIAGIVLAGVLHFQSLGSGVVRDDGTIERAPAGGSDRRVSVTALPAPVPEPVPESVPESVTESVPESVPGSVPVAQEEAERAKTEKMSGAEAAEMAKESGTTAALAKEMAETAEVTEAPGTMAASAKEMAETAEVTEVPGTTAVSAKEMAETAEVTEAPETTAASAKEMAETAEVTKESGTTAVSAKETEEPEKEAEAAVEQGGEETEKKKDFGTYTVTVHARRLTRPEAEKQAGNILKRFPDCLLGDNADADDIRQPLKMPAAEELFPFAADWESSRYAVLDTDGSIFNSEYADDRAEKADLTLILTYGDWRFEKKMSFTVRAPVRDEETRFRGEIENTLKEAEKKSSEDNIFSLPSEADGTALVWKEQIEDVSSGILLMGMLICACAWYMMDRRIHERTIERSRQLAIDYPQLISRIVLYLGAGMSVRNVFYKCASEYRSQQEAESKRKAGKKQNIRYLYEEILLVCNELDSGVAEAEAYMHFGRRCHSRQYTKLCSLLVQNLRRGNDTLLAVLQEEAQSSFEERKNLARELGEEAGTKLLLPMMIMLGVTMLIIIVPAYFSFSM